MSTLSFDEMFGLDDLPATKPTTSPSTSKPANQLAFFVEKYAPIARAAGERLGVEPELLLGQWGLETGWGRSVISDTHNLGNIKDFSGKGPKARDNMTGSTDSYRQYESPEAFAEDFSNLIGNNKRYAAALGAGGDAKRYFAGLKQGGYAEDPAYVAKGTQAVNMARRALGNVNPSAQTPKLTGEPASRSQQTQFAQSPMTDDEMLDIIGVNRMAQPDAPMPERSFLQAGGDTALAAGQTLIGLGKSIFDLGGADNPVSQVLDDAVKGTEKFKSDYAQRRNENSQRRIEDAQGEGVQAELKAYWDALWDAPIEMAASAAASYGPFGLIGRLAKGAQVIGLANAAKKAGVSKEVFMASPAGKLAMETITQAVNRGATAASTTLAAGLGVGGVKGQQYETTLREAKAAGKSDEEARKLAVEAQAYGSPGTVNQVLGGALGVASVALGPVERALTKVKPAGAIATAQSAGRPFLARTGLGALKESVPEGLQDFQQPYAGNEAAISAGVMDPSRRFEGAFGQGMQSAVLAAPMGGVAGAMEPGPIKQNKPAQPQNRPAVPPAAPPAAQTPTGEAPPAPPPAAATTAAPASPLDLGQDEIDQEMAKLSDDELQAMMADVESREDDATDEDWVNYSAAMAELDRRKNPPAATAAPATAKTDGPLSAIFDTDNVYQGWSNVRDGSDRADMLNQIDGVAAMYRNAQALSTYTPEQLDYELKAAYKWYRSAAPEQRQAAVEKILGKPLAATKSESQASPAKPATQTPATPAGDRDPLYENALDIATGDQAGTTSIQNLQGALRIGYNRAARLVEEMVSAGDLAPNERGSYNVLAKKAEARANDQDIASAPAPEAPTNLFGDMPGGEPEPVATREPPEYDYYDLSEDDRGAYDAAYAIDDDTRDLIDRFVPADVDDDLIPGFDAAADNTVSDEDFLRQLGATDEEIADGLSTTQRSQGAQSADSSPAAVAPNVTPGAQAVPERVAQQQQELGNVPQQGDIQNYYGEPFSTKGAAQQRTKKKDARGGQVVPVQGGFVVRMPQNMSGTDAKAGPGFTAADVVRRDPIAGQKINDEWTAFAPQSGTLGIPRAEMPQVKAGDRGAMVNFLKARGIDSSKEQLPPTALKPTQAEFSPAKVQEAADRTDGDRRIIVSADGHVVDGHHQWLAQRQKGEPVNVIRLDQPIAQVLDALKEMPSAQPEQKQDGATRNTAQKQAQPSETRFVVKTDPVGTKVEWQEKLPNGSWDRLTTFESIEMANQAVSSQGYDLDSVPVWASDWNAKAKRFSPAKPAAAQPQADVTLTNEGDMPESDPQVAGDGAAPSGDADAIAGAIQQSIAERSLSASEKFYREQVAKRLLSQESADAEMAKARDRWSKSEPTERTKMLARAIAEKDPRPLVDAWAKEGQGIAGSEGSISAFEKSSGLKLSRLPSAGRAKAIFGWAGWSDEQASAYMADRSKAKADADAAYEAKYQAEVDARVSDRAGKELVHVRDTDTKLPIREYVDGLISQGFNRLTTAKKGAITKTYLADDAGRGYELPPGLMREYAQAALRNADRGAKKDQATQAEESKPNQPQAQQVPALNPAIKLNKLQQREAEAGGAGLAGELDPQVQQSLLAMRNNQKVPDVPVKRYPNGNISWSQADVPDFVDLGNGYSLRGYTRDGAVVQEIKLPNGMRMQRQLNKDGTISAEMEGDFRQIVEGQGFAEAKKLVEDFYANNGMRKALVGKAPAINEKPVPAQQTPAVAATETVAPEVGPFGPILTQYYHDAQGAIKALTALQDGEAVAALYHPDVGDIDLVWGKEGTSNSDGLGLAKLVKWHPEVLGDLQGFLNRLRKDEATSGPNRIRLVDGQDKAVVRLQWDGKAKNWLLTAFESNAPKDSTRTDTGAADVKDDTASLNPERNQSVPPTDAVAQPVTRADVAAAERLAADMIRQKIAGMKAGEVQRIAARFLPTMGKKAPVGKAKIADAMTDVSAFSLLNPAAELGVELSESVKRALTADREGRVVESSAEAPAGQPTPAAEPQRFEYPTPLPGQPEEITQGQRAAVDFMNGDIDKPTMLRRFAEIEGLRDYQIRQIMAQLDGVSEYDLDQVRKARLEIEAQAPRKGEQRPKLTGDDRYRYVTKRAGEADADVAAQNKVVDYMNGDISRTELMDYLASTDLPEGSIIAFTQRMQDDGPSRGELQEMMAKREKAATAAATQASGEGPSLDDLEAMLSQAKAQYDAEGIVKNANTRRKVQQLESAIEDIKNPAVLNALDGNATLAKKVRLALEYKADAETNMAAIRGALTGLTEDYRERYTQAVLKEIGDSEAIRPAEDPATEAQLEAIFAGLEADGLKKRKAEAALAERTDDAEVINQVEAQFYDLLVSLMDRGDLEINGHKTIHKDNESCL